MAELHLVPSAEGERRLRLRHGGRAQGLRPATSARTRSWCAWTRRPGSRRRETRTPLPARPGRKAALDFEYERNGTANLFMVCAPLVGWRHVEITDRRTKRDFARVLRDIADLHFPGRRIVLVMDNLNTHRLSTLYETFAPAEASRLADRFEVHHTPKHGSWLNIAEIEINVLSRQCLDRRIPDRETMLAQVGAWERERNEASTPVDWRFTVEQARCKLKSLYPSMQ